MRVRPYALFLMLCLLGQWTVLPPWLAGRDVATAHRPFPPRAVVPLSLRYRQELRARLILGARRLVAPATAKSASTRRLVVGLAEPCPPRPSGPPSPFVLMSLRC
jgi:hypothetical protein